MWKQIALIAIFVGVVAGQDVPGVVNCNPLLSLNCNNDCMEEHGGLSGACNVNTMCICHYSNDTLLPGVTIPPPAEDIPHFPIQQCATDDRMLGGLQYAAYSFACSVDCLCSHGATAATCDFVNHMCHCNYKPTDTFDTITSSGCPYCVTTDLANLLQELLQAPLLSNVIIPLFANLQKC